MIIGCHIPKVILIRPSLPGLAQSRGHLKKTVPSRAGSRSRDPARDRGIQIVHPQKQESKINMTVT